MASGFRNSSGKFVIMGNPAIFLPVESAILGFGIRNPTNDWNPESKFHRQNMGIQYLVESGIHGEESRMQDCKP